MTDADAGRGSASSGSPPFARLGALVDEATRFWDQAADGSRRALAGDFSPSDAMSQLDSWVSASSACALRLAESLLGEAPPDTSHQPGPDAGTWSATMTVLPSVTQRPLTLRTKGLRAIGLGPATQIPPSDVTFVPTVLMPGIDTFDVTVAVPGPPGPTRIFEGDVEAVETNAPVTDPIRPNNRDGGPVR